MEKDKINVLKETVTTYILTPQKISSILSELKEEIEFNSKLLIESNKEDVKIYKKQIKIDEILKIIDGYKDAESTGGEKGSRVIVYRGDPYLTLHICIQALVEGQKVLLVYDEFMKGVNEILLQIINNVLNRHKVPNLINVSTEYSIKAIKEIEDIFDEIVIIGDTTMYQALETEKKIKFYPYNNIILYCEDEELEKLQEAIYIYANENQYEIEILYEDNIDDAIDAINAEDFANIAVLLTQNDESREQFEDEIENKEIYINKNPFKKEVGKIYNYI